MNIRLLSLFKFPFQRLPKFASLAMGICFCLISPSVGNLWAQVQHPGSTQPHSNSAFNVPSTTGAIEPNSANKIRINKPPSPHLSFGRGSRAIQNAIQPLTKQFESSVVELESDLGKVTTGTVVSTEDGFIIGKFSDIGEKFFVHLEGEKVPGRLVAYHRFHDLALVKVPAEKLVNKEPIKFPGQSDTSAATGDFVVSINNNVSNSAIGMISIAARKFHVEQPKCVDCIDLGAHVSPFVTTKRFRAANGTETFQMGLEVQRVYPRSVSEQSGLLAGDLLQSINDVTISSQIELKNFTKGLRVGQTLKFVVVRDGLKKELSTRIESFAPRMIHDRWGGGPFSEKRFGFAAVISHDSIITPADCGGPLVDLRGQVVGINIARSMRVASFAIPIKEVHLFVNIVDDKAKLVYQD